MGRILIVDDTMFMRTLLKNILFSGGHDIVGEAADGAEALARYQELKPDLVTMDVVMPKVNGIEALKAIKAADPAAKSSCVRRSARSRWSNLLSRAVREATSSNRSRPQRFSKK